MVTLHNYESFQIFEQILHMQGRSQERESNYNGSGKSERFTIALLLLDVYHFCH
jgi:hypothetical protein